MGEGLGDIPSDQGVFLNGLNVIFANPYELFQVHKVLLVLLVLEAQREIEVMIEAL